MTDLATVGATSSPAPDAPECRGSLSIADKVVTRIAAHAASRVGGVVATGSTLDKVVGRRLPRATAEVHGNKVRLTVEVAAAWPTPLGQLVRDVRAAVRQGVETLSGFHVQLVDVTVAKMERPSPPPRRRVS